MNLNQLEQEIFKLDFNQQLHLANSIFNNLGLDANNDDSEYEVSTHRLEDIKSGKINTISQSVIQEYLYSAKSN